MVRLRERIFALSGAILFFVTSAALTVIVIVQMVQDNHNNKQAAVTTAQNTCQDSQAEPTLPAPDAYKPAGTVQTLETTDLQPGSGAAVKSGDCLVVKYYGTLAGSGSLFDENFSKPEAFAFKLGQGQVIPGWDQGLVGLKPDGVRRLVIPAALGYGSQGQGSTIPPNSDLVFVVKLLRIQK